MQSYSVPNPLHTNKPESALCLQKTEAYPLGRASATQKYIILKSLLKYNEKIYL